MQIKLKDRVLVYAVVFVITAVTAYIAAGVSANPPLWWALIPLSWVTFEAWRCVGDMHKAVKGGYNEDAK